MITLIVVATGMAYGVTWGPVVLHVPRWRVPGDIWAAYRSAHYVAWGALGSVYAVGTGLVTFPGIILLEAPLAALTGHLGLSEGFPFAVPHPTAWLALGPYEMVLGCVALCACDALAEALGASSQQRWLLCIVQGIALWPVLVVWGHPEDPLAVALAVYALVLALDDRWTGAGWLLGAAVATQPLVLLVVPVFVGWAGASRVRGLALRVLSPAALLVATPLIDSFHATWHALMEQPNYPRIDHATPWTTLAPHLGGNGRNLAVAAGPGRVMAVVAACALGVWARRLRQRPDLLTWAAAVALATRCLTESVMVPYYAWPPLALALVAAFHRPTRLTALAIASVIWVTVCSEFRLGEWPWWVLVTGGIGLALLASSPSGWPSRRGAQLPIDLSTARRVAGEQSSSFFLFTSR